MDFLTHLCLPIAVVFVFRPDLARAPQTLGLAGFGLLSDADKFLGMQGLFHSLIPLVPLWLGLVLIERRLRGRLDLAPVIIALIASHLVLDFIDGGPVPLLFPVIETGLGLQYPVQITFGEGVLGVQFEGPFVALRTPTPRSGFQTFNFINGTGVMSALVFLSIYLKQETWIGRIFDTWEL